MLFQSCPCVKHYNLLIRLNGLMCAGLSEKGSEVSPAYEGNYRGLAYCVLPSMKRALFGARQWYREK